MRATATGAGTTSMMQTRGEAVTTAADIRDLAETSVIGAILQDSAALSLAAEALTPADFFKRGHALTFMLAVGLYRRGDVADYLTVTAEMVRRGLQDEVGGAGTIIGMVDAVPTTAHVPRHIEVVREASRRRSLEAMLRTAATRVAADGAGLSEVIGEIRRDLDELGTPTGGPGALDTVTLADVEPEAVSWLWPGRIPTGKLSLVIGDPGQGKSCATLDVAARVSRGLSWPGGGAAPIGGVVLLTAEDGLADTVRPRLDAMGADPRRVVAIRGVRVPGEATPAPFRLAEDVAHLGRTVTQTGALLVIVDPVSAYLGRTDSYKDAEVRGVLAPLAALAERTGAAVVAIMHLTKDAQRKVLYRAQGSLAFVAAARAVFAVAEDREDPERRLFLPVKNNLGPKPPGLGFRLVGAGNVARVEWDAEPVMVDADTALAGPEPREDQSKHEEAKDFLLDLLSAGPIPAREAQRQARETGISERTLDRAKARLGVRSVREDFRGPWVWTICRLTKGAKDATPTYGAQSGTVGTLGEPEPPAEVDEVPW